MFVLQGSWDFNPEYADFFGTVLHGIQIGSNWEETLNINPAFISDKPDGADCFLADWGGNLHVAAHYDCNNGLSTTSTLSFMADIANGDKWTFEESTVASDLPSAICEQQCNVQELDTFWYIRVEDLVIPCEQADQIDTLVNNWLLGDGHGRAFSSCSSVSISNNYSGLTYTCGSSTSTEVIFTASDACGHTFSDTGLITVVDEHAPIWTIAPISLYLNCASTGLADSLIADWLDQYGGGFVSDACNEVSISNDFIPQALPCDTVIEVVFIARDTCGNEATTTSSIQMIDDTPPIFAVYPHDLYLSCDGGYDIQDSISYWLGQFGHAITDDDCSAVTEYIYAPNDLDSVACPVDTSISVTFFIRDACNNFNQAIAWIHIRSMSALCDSSFYLVQDSTSIVLRNYMCNGHDLISWQYRDATDSLWSDLYTGTDTTIPALAGQGYYRALTTCHNECPDSAEYYYPVCDSLNMVIEDSAIGIKWGELYYGSVPVSNYLVSWVNDVGDEVFRSGAGIYKTDSVLPHPLPVFQPVVPDNYIPIVLESDYGVNLSCFDSVTVDPLMCGDEYAFQYSGVGGIVARHETEFTIEDTTYLKFWFHTKFGTTGNPDRLLITYDNETILNTGFVLWPNPQILVRRIDYKPGVEKVKIIIENEGNPSDITRYVFKVDCCDSETPCDSIEVSPVEYSQVQNSGANCFVDLLPDSTWTHEYFWQNYCIELNQLLVPDRLISSSTTTSCVVSSSGLQSCTDGQSITVSNLASKGFTSGAGFALNFSSDFATTYDFIKTKILERDTSISRYLELRLNRFGCSEDTASRASLVLFPFASSTTFNDANREIVIVMDSPNPYDTSDFECRSLLSALHNIFMGYYGYNSTDTRYFDTFESLELTNKKVASKTILGLGSSQPKSFSNSSCLKSTQITFDSYNHNCACSTWYLQEDGITIDSAGSTECPLPDIHQENPISQAELRDGFFKIYPNPSKGLLIVDFINEEPEQVQIHILDLNGELVQHHKYPALGGNNSVELDLNNLPGGMYMLQMRGQSEHHSDRFILMR